MIETTVETKRDLTILKCSGDLKEKELLDNLESLYGGSPTLYTLWDLSNSSMINISQVFVKKLFDFVKKKGSIRQSGKTAVVAPTDLEFGMARMFQIMSDTDIFPFEIKVFRHYEEATQWLFEKE